MSAYRITSICSFGLFATTNCLPMARATLSAGGDQSFPAGSVSVFVESFDSDHTSSLSAHVCLLCDGQFPVVCPAATFCSPMRKSCSSTREMASSLRRMGDELYLRRMSLPCLVAVFLFQLLAGGWCKKALSCVSCLRRTSKGADKGLERSWCQ
ncbi:hypothetical protein BaRGS_00002688 [Batillaria attramentaria]|uniref:Secreted protein n=1 Tax=Batillaria attramentaria TaxID=370345 RepID=A0ABD0M3Q8_9CAEN